jgi:hypothetical protein
MPGPSITYTGSGTEPLRSNPTTKSSPAPKMDAGAGKPAGGTDNMRANFVALSAKAAKMAKGSPDRMPAGVQTFKDGVTK